MKLVVTKTAAKQLLKIPRERRTKIESSIEKLPKQPFPPQSRKLTGRLGWRLRVGDYRVLYTIDNKRQEITILSAQHRKDAYR